MANGFIKYGCLLIGLICATICVCADEYKVVATPMTQDIKDLSERNSKVLDQNGERCALLKFETVIPKMFTFNLGAQQIEKRVNKEDEVWIWVSPDVKKMTIRCSDCTALKDYRVSLKSGCVYRARLTTGLPAESSTTQYLNVYCEQVPYQVAIDGAEPVTVESRSYNVELPIGKHQLSVSSRYYQTYTKDVRLERSRAYNDTVVLVNNYGELSVHANLTNYEVMVDGEVRPFASAYRVEPGKHYITLTKTKYQTVQDTVHIRLGQRTNYKVNFEPNFTIVYISAREPKTEIWVDDSLRGHDRMNLELMYGYHRIEGRREGFDSWEYPIHEFTSQSDRNIVIPKLNQQYGAVRLSVFPHEASLFVDGREEELRDGIYSDKQLTVGKHFVYLRMTDYHSIRDSITIDPSKLTSKEYYLEHIPLGTIALQTDPGIGIFLLTEGDTIFRGTQMLNSKFPAGENVIMLKHTNGDRCFHHIFVNEGAENPRASLPFFRKTLFRSNVSLKMVNLCFDPNREQPVRLNKRLELAPLCYVVKASKKGYEDYVDTLDLSKSDANNVVYAIDMRKLGDTLSVQKPTSKSPLRHQFYSNAGRWYVGVVNVGYTYSFVDTTHIVSLGALSFRYKMLGVSLLNFDLPVYGSTKLNLLYNPKLSLVVPFSRGGAVTVYGGLNVNLQDWYNQRHDKTSTQKVRSYVRGGISLLANKSGKAPFEIFGEYRYPLNDAKDYNKAQLFRVGINFSFGVDI